MSDSDLDAKASLVEKPRNNDVRQALFDRTVKKLLSSPPKKREKKGKVGVPKRRPS